MKKILMTLALCGALFMMAGCSSNTPTGVVKKAMDLSIKGDNKAYAELFAVVKEDATPEEVEEFRKDLFEMAERLDEKTPEEEKVTDYEVLSEELSESGKYAKVVCKQFLKNGEEETAPMYLMKDKDGKWELLFMGTDRLLEK